MRTPEDVAAMHCPTCRVPLAMSDRQGIEIDYCPQCRGVWLDRGELDKIVERSMAAAAPAQPAPPPRREAGSQGPWGNDPDYGDSDYGHPDNHGYAHEAGHGRGQGQHGYRGKPHKRRKSFLEELFD